MSAEKMPKLDNIKDAILDECPTELKVLPEKIPFPKFLINDALGELLREKKIFIDHETQWIKRLTK